tara:strand:- start:7379 stop:8158 length:780 start_codon:yes stop_codon:yes gene_type:complete
MLIDSHCHLDYPEIYDQIDDVIKRAIKNQVKYLLSISTTLQSFEKINLIINKYNNVYGTLGIHPHEAKSYTYLNHDFLINLVKKNKKIIGIGETGLDYFYNHSEKVIQKKSFEEHIIAAQSLNLPVIVHTRNADDDTFDMLNSLKKDSNLKILIHCFTGTKEFAKKLLNLDSYISLSGIITFKNTNALLDAVKYIPIEKILLETDSPYLAPIPYRGKPNEPSYLIHTCEKLAKIKKLSPSDIMKHTSKNFFNLFNILLK